MSDQVGPNRSLLVMCTAVGGKAGAYPNLAIKRIRKTVLSRCEVGPRQLQPGGGQTRAETTGQGPAGLGCAK